MTIIDKVNTITRLAEELGPEYVYDLQGCLDLLEMAYRYRLQFRKNLDCTDKEQK